MVVTSQEDWFYRFPVFGHFFHSIQFHFTEISTDFEKLTDITGGLLKLLEELLVYWRFLMGFDFKGEFWIVSGGDRGSLKNTSRQIREHYAIYKIEMPTFPRLLLPNSDGDRYFESKIIWVDIDFLATSYWI